LSHKRWVAIAVLFVVSVVLARVTVAIRRLHERTVSELKADSASRAEKIELLSKMLGRVEQTIRLISHNREMGLQMLPQLAEELKKTLWLCYRAEGAAKFKGEWTYTAALPESESEWGEWLWRTRDRLPDLIKAERPPSDETAPSVRAPNAAYKI
jgi:hypothetical protein